MKLNDFTLVRPDVPRFSDPEPRQADDRREPVQKLENVSELFELGAHQKLEFNGVPLSVPPVGGLDGAHLYQLQARVRDAQLLTMGGGKLTDEEYAAYVSLLHEIIATCTSLVRPVRRRDKLRYRFKRWKPFRGATARELGLLMGFLSKRQTVSRIRLPEAIQ